MSDPYALMSTTPVIGSDVATLAGEETVIAFVKLGTTVNRDNYENDRYDISLSIRVPANGDVSAAIREVAEQVRASLRAEVEYDGRIRALVNEIEHYNCGEYTAEEWLEKANAVSEDATLQPADRRWLHKRLMALRIARVERDEAERAQQERWSKVIERVLNVTREYAAEHPEPETLGQSDTWRPVFGHMQMVQAPDYYMALYSIWGRTIPQINHLPRVVIGRLTNATIGALCAATPADILNVKHVLESYHPNSQNPQEDEDNDSDDFRPDPDF